MNSPEVIKLICDTTFRTLVREGKSLQAYIVANDSNMIQDAVELIQYLDAQQDVYTSSKIEHNYNNVLRKILFNS